MTFPQVPFSACNAPNEQRLPFSNDPYLGPPQPLGRGSSKTKKSQTTISCLPVLVKARDNSVVMQQHRDPIALTWLSATQTAAHDARNREHSMPKCSYWTASRTCCYETHFSSSTANPHTV